MNRQKVKMITGSCVALVTPMNQDGNIHWESLENLIEWHINQNTDAIVTLGTTGESATLSDKERAEVLKFTIEKVNHRLPVIAGTGSNATQKTIDMTKEAKSLGADACLLVVPYYNKPGQEGLYQHFHHIAEAVSIPQILYNVPGRTITDLLPETVERLMDHQNIIGIKEATGDMQRADRLIKSARGKNFSVYSGDDATAFDLMSLGGQGVISVAANVVPDQVHDLCQLAMAKQMEKAGKIDQSLTPLYHALFTEANPVPVKWALQKMNKIPEGIRLPLTPLNPTLQETVIKALVHAGISVNK